MSTSSGEPSAELQDEAPLSRMDLEIIKLGQEAVELIREAKEAIAENERGWGIEQWFPCLRTNTP